MIQHRFPRPVWALLAVTALAVGCSDTAPITGAAVDDVPGSNGMEDLDLSLPYGGLAFTDEPAAFGNAALLAEAVEEEAALRAEAEEAETIRQAVPTLRDAPEVARTYVRILWGNLDGARPELRTLPEDTPAWTVWDGSLSVTEGAIALRKTILFERPYDHLLPRVGFQALSWHSTTLPHVDGILVCVLSRPDAEGNLPGEITFETGPATRTFAIADLADLEETVRVDDQGNGVSFVGLSGRPGLCPRGFLGGLWKANDDGDGGVFRGRVTHDHGRLRGYVMGRYGTTRDGDRVFAGKFIDEEGRILGLLQGTWEPSAEEDGTGVFRGRWAGRDGETAGLLRGRYLTRPDRPGGVFQGYWERSCEGGDSR